MRVIAISLVLLGLGTALMACDAKMSLSDPNDLLPPGDRPARGPGLFTGEDGVFKITLPE